MNIFRVHDLFIYDKVCNKNFNGIMISVLRITPKENKTNGLKTFQ
jgi:hypothetical protein